MKTSFRSPNQGGILIITLCIALIIGTGLVSYLLLIHSQNKLVSRSQYWNMAMAHAEAGVEEALAQLNYKFGTNNMNLATNGWGGPSGGVYGPMIRSLKTGAYRASISNDWCPTIYSTGYATNPISGVAVARTVEVKTRAGSAFQVGMAAKLDIDFMGNYIYIDSYDSADTSHSTNGNYYLPWAKAGGDVASTVGFVNVQNADVHGKLKTGPDGSYAIGPGGLVGPIGFAGPGLYDSTWYQNDFNADFKDVDPPYTGGFGLPAGVGTNYTILLSEDYYIAGNLKLTGAKKTILVLGNARLYVTGDLSLPSTWEIKIDTNATLKIFVGTTDKTTPVSGEFPDVNTSATSDAAAFGYYGLPSNTAVTWTGNAAFKGTVYAPQAVFTLGGGGMNTWDYQGACVVSNVKMNGKFNFHFDENLKRKGPVSLLVAGSWRER